MLPHSELILRVAAGAALGGVIGYERGRHGRPVGLRTHMIVALASATFMVVSSQFAYYQQFGHDEGIGVDASRIASSVVSAVGFLAGGAILRSGLSVQGLTTAAGLWLVTAIGLCAGAGMYVESFAVTLMGIVALTVLRRLEDKRDTVTRRRILVVLSDGANTSAPDIMRSITAAGGTVAEVAYERRLDEKRRTAITLDVTLPMSVTLARVVEMLEHEDGVRRIHVSRPS